LKKAVREQLELVSERRPIEYLVIEGATKIEAGQKQ
jgi:hypothetical protein